MTTIATLATSLAALAVSATELQQAGAIRPDHESRWGALRVQVDQLAESALAAATADPAPASPDATAFDRLTDAVQALAMLVDDLSDQVRAHIETHPAAGG